ncbi:2TM domain-containing protein [Flavobacterium fluvii]|uniref:2TM domain-containing protein n=1 Tax=Flavobacterium fluvii TaxID=468056 RepID=A0A1M5NZC4_9FLAO|nr:2TM domain-containing protein [Flavobacterium fluvii]SHG94924.1 2TM domain-containing protein [Flavobacterium fluvii]
MKNDYVKEFPRAFFIGLAIFVVLNLIRAFNGNFSLDERLGVMFLYTILYSFALHLSNTFLFITLDKIFIKKRFSKRRIFIGFVSSFFLTLFVIFLLRVFINTVIENKPFDVFIANESASDYVVASFFAFAVLLIVHFVYLYKGYQENKVKEQKIIAGTASAKFESLKNQIDPHFLFNSLNVLSSLIEENPDNAQKFTTSLSKIYRYVLEQKDKELVSVEEELAFAKTYMNLLKMRFENSLFYELPATIPNPEAKVVPLSLQLLLENTVKHNVVSEQRPLKIRIFMEADYLAIQNDYRKKEVLQDRQGVGLQNIINRYGIITNRKVLIEQNEQTFTVKIPVLTKQISIMESSTNYIENSAYYRAKKRVEELKGFYGNLISYCCVIPFLIFINLTYMPNFQWFWFSAAGWGFGLLMHAFKVFGYSSNWEERKIQEILRKEDKKQTWK